MAEVKLSKLKKVYEGGVVAVHESDLHIEDKEFMVLVGPSGCGKSTTLRMVAGLEEISGGELHIGDRLVNDVAPKDRDIAMVFQNYALYPHMTVYDNMAFGLKLRKTPKAEIQKRVMEAAESLELTDYLKRKPKALSGGQRQRVALGRAIVRDPAVFLLDEPLSNLDAKMRVGMRKELKLLHQRLQTTMIYVTHDQIEAMTLGNRICVMSHGYIQQVGKPLDVYDFPVNKFVAGFIGTPTMNFLEGDLREEGDSVVFVSADVKIQLPKVKSDKCRAHLGKASFGVRPEKMTIAKQAAEGISFKGRVEFIEKLGDTQQIFLKVGNQSVTATAEAHYEIEAGDDVFLAPDMERVHIFAGEHEANITL
ncbi:sn-glycerol-3-phosphate ABC transporter ATP-binding protein UgpC [Lentisphaera profundi]|uniref:Sn-glycerol-3-phosphate ABC transporter ATP-binding protein UgpC n=1 Tax=Lentisphaera profundi TaxID=1658616 RepID=A0ABY7VPA1_9BACT|nr:sn-glycerol-3-phosphate ABC transporter ATP-binding protein UgpC [Lentisphaera profundi]WDE95539.1 sn-glycerol-3-phosphate ABC transporter ATP-binding protein UgpC [Lentisphaera profundi]